MAVDYDLVVIGGTLAGITAARQAAQLQARVALVLPEDWEARADESWFSHHAALQLAFNHFPESSPESQPFDSRSWNWLVQSWEEQHSPALLAALGVEIIFGTGQFTQRPHLALRVNQRELRSRAYLLAPCWTPSIPEIEGLRSLGFIATTEFGRWCSKSSLPKSVLILGGEPAGLEIAQALVHQQVAVTLAVSDPYLLPQEDADCAQLIQAQLEADGVRVLTGVEVTQIKQIDGQKWLQVGNQAIATDEIVLATTPEPQVASLNLTDVGVRWNARGIAHNAKLQTTNPRVYVCGGRYESLHQAQAEAAIALKNALWFPRWQIDERGVAAAVFTHPQFVRVGLTEVQARKRYGKDVVVLRQSVKTLAKAQIRQELTGLCKLIVRRNGTILGAHLVGAEVSELVPAIALAIRKNIKINAIAELPVLSPTFAEILQATAASWKRDRTTRWQDWREWWFNFRRSWSV